MDPTNMSDAQPMDRRNVLKRGPVDPKNMSEPKKVLTLRALDPKSVTEPFDIRKVRNSVSLEERKKTTLMMTDFVVAIDHTSLSTPDLVRCTF